MRRIGHNSPKIKLAVKIWPVMTGQLLTAIERSACGWAEPPEAVDDCEPGTADSAITAPNAIFQPIGIRNGTSWNNPEATCY